MSNQKTPREINLGNARAGGQKRPVYDQAADPQRPASAAGQVRRTPQSASQIDPRVAAQQEARRKAYYEQQAAIQRREQQQRAAQQRPSQGQRPAAPSQRSAAPSQRTAPSQQRPANGGASRRPGAQPQGGTGGRRPQQVPPSVARRRAQQQRKKKALNRLLIGLSSVLALILVAYIGIQVWGSSIVNEGEMGSINKVVQTPPQFKDKQLSVLVCGIDYSTEDAVKRDPIGNTDMIMYMRFNFEDNTIKMLQIPRDLFMGPDIPTGGSGKLNGVFRHTPNEDNRMQAVADVIYNQLQLPVDGYVTIDMDSLREIVDLFGGIEVYVAQDMSYKGSALEKGWHNLMGAECEYFLRDRYSFATADIGRLDNQRYFYSALFRRIRTATWQDIVKLMPVAQQYINTNISLNDCMGLGIKMLKIPSANIMMCRLPTFDNAERYNGSDIQIAAKEETAALLNEYFRTPETAVPANMLTFADWPHGGTAHQANVQWMGEIDAQGGGTVGQAADDVTTGDDLLNPASSASTPAA